MSKITTYHYTLRPRFGQQEYHQACKDIKMISKLLDHSRVVVTQVYAEVQMANKVEVVNHLNGNFDK